MTDWLLPLLRCPVCGGSLTFRAIEGSNANGFLRHQAGTCAEQYPVIDGVPRMILGPTRGALMRGRQEWFAQPRARFLRTEWSKGISADPVIDAFDDEWSRYRDVGTTDHADLFARYFDLVPISDELFELRPALADSVEFFFPAAPLSLDDVGLYGGRAWWPIDMNELVDAVEQGKINLTLATLDKVARNLKTSCAGLLRGIL